MIVHGHGDVKYAHYDLNSYLGDANHTVAHFQNYCVILRSRRYAHRVCFLMVLERHPFTRQCLKERTFVYHHYRNEMKISLLENHCLQLFTFNLIIVLKTTNADTCFAFGRCSSQNESSKRCSCLFWWWGTRTMTLMRHSVVGVWSCIKRYSHHITLHEVVHEFGQCARDPAHDRGNT